MDRLLTEYHVASLFEMFVLASDNTWIMDNDVNRQLMDIRGSFLYQVVIFYYTIALKLNGSRK